MLKKASDIPHRKTCYLSPRGAILSKSMARPCKGHWLSLISSYAVLPKTFHVIPGTAGNTPCLR